MQVIRRAIIFSLSMIAAEVVAQSKAPVHPGLMRLAYRPAFAGAFNHLTDLESSPTLRNAIAIAKQLAGEFIPFDGARLSFVEVDTAILWLVLPAGSVTDIALPNGARVSSWRFANGEAGVQGISYQLSVQNCANIWWGGISTTGARSTFRNSELLAMGLIFAGTDSVTRLRIVNLVGQEVARLVEAQLDAGHHEMIWHASSFASGIYFAVLESEEARRRQKLVITR